MSYNKRYKVSYDIIINVDKSYTRRSDAVKAKHDLIGLLTDLMRKGIIKDYNIYLEDTKLDIYL